MAWTARGFWTLAITRSRAATARASEDIEGEHAVHQRWPGPGARGDGSTGAGLEGVAVRGRAAVVDDLRAPARRRGEDAVIQEQVHRGPGNEGCQLLQEFDGLEEVRRAIAPDGHEFDENAPVGAAADAVLGEWGAEQMATELLQASAIVGGTQTLAWRSRPSTWA
jgi:hypothetical protein